MVANDVTIDELMAEIHAACKQDDLEPGEFTIPQYMEKTGLKREEAERELKNAVNEGLLVEIRKDVIMDRKMCHIVYRKKDSE